MKNNTIRCVFRSVLLAGSCLAIVGPAYSENRLLDNKSVYDWSGFYFGAHVGAMVGRTTALEYNGDWDYGEYSKSEAAVLGGVQAGFNQQVGNFVYGLEADISATTFDVDQRFDLASTTEANSGQWNWMSTLRGRAGLAVGNNLFYTTAGLAFVDVDYAFGEPSDPADYTTYDSIEVGLAIGAGFERAIDENWSWRAEYLYLGLPRTNGGAGSNFGGDTGGFTSSAHLARFGLNYSPYANASYAASDGAPMTAGDWSGWFVGANLGGGITSSTALEYSGVWDLSEYSIEETNFVGGIQGGYNWQNGHTVFGIEADVNLSSFDEQDYWSAQDYVHSGEWDWFSTVRAKAGLSVGNAIAYVTGGLAIVDRRQTFSDDLTTPDEFVDGTELGIALGAGVEMAIDNHWSARLEYLHINLQEELIADFGGDLGSFQSATNIARLGVNYAIDGNRPGSGTAAPETIDWNGFYAGLYGGFGLANSTTTEYSGPWDYGDYSINEWAGLAGGLVGWNGQKNNFVYGLEADIAWTSFDQTHNFNNSGFPPQANTHEMNWLSTIRARAGVAAGSSLIYATGGLALADMNYRFGDRVGPDLSLSETAAGIAVGAGLEHDFGNGWAARMEVMHVSFESEVDTNFDPNFPVNFSTSGNFVKFGITKRM